MQQYTLDPKALLGGIIHSDIDQEIVQLSLQKDNEIPDYQADAIILLLNRTPKVRQKKSNFWGVFK